ncbi:MAG: efflux RND transporter periplasmic adaptor subunit [Pseudomonadales bacterium]|nr:efflux RND transporter periplasmic adaptor subunit [Pseudomonadales bacterium]
MLRSLFVVVALLSPLTVNADVAALGRLEPSQGVKRISAPVILESGNGILLKSLEVGVGDRVAAGQLLAKTESEGLLAALLYQAKTNQSLRAEQSAAAVAVAHADCVRAAVSRREADRRNQLLDQDLSSREEAERASANAEFQEATCHASSMEAEASKAAVNVAQAEVAHREVLLARTQIVAPSAGTIVQINTWPGEAIGPQGILELANTDQMFAIAEIYETDIAYLKLGQRAQVTSSAFSETLLGTVTFIRPLVRKQDVMGTDPAASKDARVIEVEVKLDHSEPVQTLTNLQVEILFEVES